MSKKHIFLLCCVLLYSALAVLPAAHSMDARSAIEEKHDSSHFIDVPGRGMTLFFPQNNPVYAQMIYEHKGSTTYRSFGAGGCAPTAAACALTALLEDEQLTVLAQHSADGQPFSLCVHAINKWSCTVCHERMPILSAADHRAYLPAILGSYACGNNPEGTIWRRNARSAGGSGGTSAQFLQSICPLLSLSCCVTNDVSSDEWLNSINKNTVAVALSASSPFTGAGHYVTILWVDENSIYLFDPLAPNSYSQQNDPLHCLKIIEPGLVQVSRSMYKHLGFYSVYLISKEP